MSRPCPSCPAAANLPNRHAIIRVLEQLLATLYPGCYGHPECPREEIASMLSDQVHRVLHYQSEYDSVPATACRQRATDVTTAFLDQLPAIRLLLQEDIQAAYEGDPAARSHMEIIMSYPGHYAVTVHRLAHALYGLGVPLIPRVMSEHAYSLTGIDIHPGAQIGPGFFIDHGTGVVIGETCVIGCHVKLYQGVTLGALSFAKEEDGSLVKGVKRHPNVEDNVVIYAGATILGGGTVIGKGAVIGGNVWLVHSVPPGAKVYNQQPAPVIKTDPN